MALDLLGRRAGVPRHAWLTLATHDGTDSELPFSRCGPFRLALPSGAGDVTVEILARQDEWLYPSALVQAHQQSIRRAAAGDDAQRHRLSRALPEVALTVEAHSWRVCVIDASTNGDGSILLTTSSSGPQDDVPADERLRFLLPPRLPREARSALLRGVSSTAPATVLPDRLAMWDLLARACIHRAVHGLDPAERATSRGSVASTSTHSSPGSLWPPGWAPEPRGDGDPVQRPTP